MIQTTGQSFLTIGIIAFVTFLLRVMPFALFPANAKTPKTVIYLSRVLPRAMIGMLVIYCFKGISFSTKGQWLPELIATAFIISIHLWKKSTLLSIGGGTLLYMLLVQYIFL